MTDDDATQEGVSKTKREQEIEAIRAKRAQAVAQEGVGEPDEPEVPEEGQPPEETEAAPTDDPAKDMLKFYGEDGTEYEIPATAKARLKVDGKELEEPLTKVTTRYQKGAAGDLRLQEANRVKQELEAKDKALAKRGQELTAKEQAYIKRVDAANKQKSSKQGLSEDGQKVADELITALIDADEDKAKGAMSRLGIFSRQPAQQPKIDPKTIDDRVSKVVEAKWQEREQERVKKDRDAAVQWFYEEHADLAEDDYLRTAVDRETATILRESPKKPPLEIMQEAAEKVQKWVSKKTAPQPAKGAKKRATPTPASGRRSMGEDPPPPPTRRERINEIRKRRGQAPL